MSLRLIEAGAYKRSKLLRQISKLLLALASVIEAIAHLIESLNQ